LGEYTNQEKQNVEETKQDFPGFSTGVGRKMKISEE